jgi:hypothetical protein
LTSVSRDLVIRGFFMAVGGVAPITDLGAVVPDTKVLPYPVWPVYRPGVPNPYPDVILSLAVILVLLRGTGCGDCASGTRGIRSALDWHGPAWQRNSVDWAGFRLRAPDRANIGSALIQPSFHAKLHSN